MIHPLVAQHIPEIQALCREFGVRKLEIFGSAVTGGFDPERSDVDFLVTYPDDYDFGPWIGRFFDLERALVKLLEREVDLIMIDAPKKQPFIDQINRTKVALYNAREHAVVA